MHPAIAGMAGTAGAICTIAVRRSGRGNCGRRVLVQRGSTIGEVPSGLPPIQASAKSINFFL